MNWPPFLLAGWTACLLLAGSPALAADPAASAAEAPAPRKLYAAEFRTGPAWDAAKPPQQQAQFQEHSANLKRLREQGRIVFGARYGEVGLVVFAGTSLEEVRGLVEADPGVAAGTFRATVNEFKVFYPGVVGKP